MHQAKANVVKAYKYNCLLWRLPVRRPLNWGIRPMAETLAALPRRRLESGWHTPVKMNWKPHCVQLLTL